MKTALKKTLGRHIPTTREFETLVVECETMLKGKMRAITTSNIFPTYLPNIKRLNTWKNYETAPQNYGKSGMNSIYWN
ncbi:hypothetical protein ANCDUO_14788 [Ancylostoma duodenale]|uniref:Uncharacterized protein n=1 Tax=Ancylostoma duodenale TaxID=51022 RepID=A0A0C2CFE7_9BILA|nr:hypothetical protein ANCDUO_14788 [Ancylostoma duodenale]